MKNFQIGDAVVWDSQAGGSTTRKKGKVVCVVPAHAYGKPWRTLPGIMRELNPGLRGRVMFGGWQRNHECYIVQVSHSGKGKPRLYAPLVSKLRKES